MNQTKRSLAVICVVVFLDVSASAQTANLSEPKAPNSGSTDVVANEIGFLRKSVQSLNATVREIGERLLAPASKSDDAKDKDRISTSLNLLTLAEQRAELLRKQLIELAEKETAVRTRLTQLEEEMRPENIERSLSPYGTTRTPELRDNRRRVLENERRGLETLVNQISQSRVRLQEDVRDADTLVTRLRQRLLPLIEKEIEKLNPNDR